MNEKNIRAACTTADLRLTWNERIIWALDRLLRLLLNAIRVRVCLCKCIWICIMQRSLSTFAAIALLFFRQFVDVCLCMRMSEWARVCNFCCVCFEFPHIRHISTTLGGFSMCVDSLLLLYRCASDLIRRRTTARFRMFSTCVRYGYTHFFLLRFDCLFMECDRLIPISARELRWEMEHIYMHTNAESESKRL